MPVSRFDKLLDALLMALSHLGERSPTMLTEEAFARAMVEALKQGKSFMRPSTFAGGGAN